MEYDGTLIKMINSGKLKPGDLYIDEEGDTLAFLFMKNDQTRTPSGTKRYYWFGSIMLRYGLPENKEEVYDKTLEYPLGQIVEFDNKHIKIKKL